MTETQSIYELGSSAPIHQAEIDPDLPQSPMTQAVEAAIRSDLDMKRADLQKEDLRGGNFENAQFAEATFHGSRLEGSSFENATLTEVNFDAAHCQNVSFRNASLKDASFYDAGLDNADFTGADLRGVDFRESDLNGTIFLGARIEGADFRTVDPETIDAILHDTKTRLEALDEDSRDEAEQTFKTFRDHLVPLLEDEQRDFWLNHDREPSPNAALEQEPAQSQIKQGSETYAKLHDYREQLEAAAPNLTEEERLQAEQAFQTLRDQLVPLLEGEESQFWMDYDRTHSPNAIIEREQTQTWIDHIENTRQSGELNDRIMSKSTEASIDRALIAARRSLDIADQKTVKLLNERGFDGDKVLQEIIARAGQSRASQRLWFENQVKAHGADQSLTHKDAKKEMLNLHKEISQVYGEARAEIRGATREVATHVGKEVEQAREAHRAREVGA